MFYLYPGCQKHQTKTSNYDCRCPDCWAEVDKQQSTIPQRQLTIAEQGCADTESLQHDDFQPEGYLPTPHNWNEPFPLKEND